MTEEMTSKERLAAYSAGKTVDRIPYNTGLNESAVTFYGYSNTDYLFSSDIMVDVEHRIIEEFGGDSIGFSINTRAFAEIAGSELEYRERGYSVIRNHIIPDKRSKRELKTIDVRKSGRLPIILDALKKAQNDYGDELPVWYSLPCPANCALGVTDLNTLLHFMLKETAFFNKLMSYCLEAVLQIADRFYAETGLTPGLFDVTAARQIMGREQYETYVLPFVKKTVEGIRRITKKTPPFSTCGSQSHLWERLLEFEIPSLNIDCTDSITEAKDRVGSHIPISGNIDGMAFLYMNDEQIDLMVKDTLLKASDSPQGFTLAIGGGPVAYGTARQTMLVYRDSILKYGAGARKGCLCEGLK